MLAFTGIFLLKKMSVVHFSKSPWQEETEENLPLTIQSGQREIQDRWQRRVFTFCVQGGPGEEVPHVPHRSTWANVVAQLGKPHPTSERWVESWLLRSDPAPVLY